MKSLAERPDLGSSFQSNLNLDSPSMWNRSCMRRSRSQPFRTRAAAPRRRKLLRISFCKWSSRGLACRMDAASMPKVRYFVLVRPLLPWASCVFSIWLYSARMSSKPSFWGGMRMLRSKLSASAAMLTKENSKWTELSKKLRKLHHSSKMAVLSSCNASW